MLFFIIFISSHFCLILRVSSSKVSLPLPPSGIWIQFFMYFLFNLLFYPVAKDPEISVINWTASGILPGLPHPHWFDNVPVLWSLVHHDPAELTQPWSKLISKWIEFLNREVLSWVHQSNYVLINSLPGTKTNIGRMIFRETNFWGEGQILNWCKLSELTLLTFSCYDFYLLRIWPYYKRIHYFNFILNSNNQ